MENKNSEYGHFSRSDRFGVYFVKSFKQLCKKYFENIISYTMKR